MDALLHALQSAVGKKDTDNKVNFSIRTWMDVSINLSWSAALGSDFYLLVSEHDYACLRKYSKKRKKSYATTLKVPIRQKILKKTLIVRSS